MSFPIFFDFRPEKNHPGIVPHTDIYFAVRDPDGINISTLQINVNGQPAVINGIIQAGYSGALTKSTVQETEYYINVNPDANFSFRQTVIISCSVEDKLGNKWAEYYSFSIIENPDQTAPVTIPSPRGGLFNSAQSIQLYVYDESSTRTFYTLDGSDPKVNGVLYTGAISLTNAGSYTLKFYSKDNDNYYPEDDNVEETKTETYILDYTPPITFINIEGGNFLTPSQIVLTTNEEATTYFTTNGTWPNTSSQIYTGPITISQEGSTILRYFSVDLAGNVETTQTQTYNINYAKSNFAPSNAMVLSPYIRGKLDIVWDDMERLDSSVLGYNVYRSYFRNGIYTKLNEHLITTTHYRDEAVDEEIIEEDVSSQFKQIIQLNKYASDQFDGNTIDKTKWKENDEDEIISQFNGLIFQSLGSKASSNITSIFKLQNDFDVQLGLDLITWEKPVIGFQEIGFAVSKANGDHIYIAKKKSQTQDIIESSIVINGTPDLPISTPSDLTLIKFRITRSDDNIIVSYVDASGSTVIHNTFTETFTDELYIVIYARTADVKLECRAYNFEVLDGEVAIVKLLNPQKEYVIKTSKRPIVDDIIDPTGNTKDVDLFMSPVTNQREYVQVYIDGIKANIKAVYGLEGEIVLNKERYWDYISRQYVDPILPNEDSIVKVTYSTRKHDVDYSLRKPLYYKVTLEHSCGETDLRFATAVTLQAESLDWLYSEALRRNHWILDQTGERVLLFIKSRAGQRCSCYENTERTHRQPKNKCTICYGTGFIPPYSDPICITIAPLMAEQKLMQTDRGMRLDYATETWAITPHIINQRDFLVRRDGTILAIGAQTVPEVRGRRLDQQHFNIQPVDRSDIRYDYIESLRLIERKKELKIECVDMVTDSQNTTCLDIPTKGRTITFKNITY